MGAMCKQFSRAENRWITKHETEVSRNIDITQQPNKTRMHRIEVGGEPKPAKRQQCDYIGVSFIDDGRGRKNPFMARIKISGNQVLIGYYSTAREAAIAYDKAAIKLGRPTNILKTHEA